MKKGFRSGIFSPPYYPTDENPTLCIQRELELIEWCDRLDYDEAWIGEHHSGGWEIIFSPELMVAAAAERTKNIRLGTGVISLPYHNPLAVAGRIVQLDHMTRGRTMFGVGPGALITDALMFGIEPAQMRDRMMESLDIVLRLLRGESVTAKSDWYDLKDARLHLQPYSSPMPEIAAASTISPSGSRAVGKYGLSMLCLTATQADGADACASNWALACELAAENGYELDPANLRMAGPMFIAETREAAREKVKFGLQKWIDYTLTIGPGARERVKGMDAVQAAETLFGAVVGTPDDAVARLREMQSKVDFGCFLHFVHHWADWEDTKKSYELFARYVTPQMRQSNAWRESALQSLRDRAETIVAGQKAGRAAIEAKHQAERAAAKAAAQ